MKGSDEGDKPQATRDQDAEFFNRANEAAVALGTSTLRSLLILNGGAAVAMLGFLAGASGSDNAFSIDLIQALFMLQLFGCGAALAAVGTGFSYLTTLMQAGTTQYQAFGYEPPNANREQRMRVWGERFRGAAIVAAILSLGFFLFSVWSAGKLLTS